MISALCLTCLSLSLAATADTSNEYLNTTDTVVEIENLKFDMLAFETSHPKQAAAKLKIKVLSGNGDLNSAKALAKQLVQIGYYIKHIDYAPRSNFLNTTIYFSANYKDPAETIAANIGNGDTILKPLSWPSEFDLILVTGHTSKKEKKALDREKRKQEPSESLQAERKETEHRLKEKMAFLLSEAHALYMDGDYALAKNKYKNITPLVKKMGSLCKKAMDKEKPNTGKETIEPKTEEINIKEIKIQVLSKEVDLTSAKKIARQVKKMGYDIHSIDYALRSDLMDNTLYFAPAFHAHATDIAFNLDDYPALKPLRWTSTYDLILITGTPPAAERLLEKLKSDEEKLIEAIAFLLSEAHARYSKEDYVQAQQKYTEIAKLIKKAEKLCEKTLQQAKIERLTETTRISFKESDAILGPKKITLSLDDAVAIAIANNALVEEADEKLKGALEEKKSARADFFPKASAEYSYTRLNEAPSVAFDVPSSPVSPAGSIEFTVGNQDIYTWNITLSQPLFTGFALLSQYRIKELGIKTAQIEKEMVVIDLVRDVKTTYFNVLLAEKVLTVADEAVKNLKAHERDAEQFYKQGMIPYNDLLKAKVALANTIQERERVKAGAKIAVSALNTLLDFDINQNTEIEGILSLPPASYKLADLLHEASENRPELKMLHLAVKSIDHGIRLVKSAYYPKIAIAGYYEQTGDNFLATENDYGAIYNSAVILQAKWMLFEGGKTRSDVAKYRYDKKAIIKKFEWAENGIKLEVKNAFTNLHVSDKNIKTAQEALIQAKENWRITNLQYQEQIATSTDVLDARTFLTQAELNRYRALYGHMKGITDLERAVGKKYPVLENQSPPIEGRKPSPA